MRHIALMLVITLQSALAAFPALAQDKKRYYVVPGNR